MVPNLEVAETLAETTKGLLGRDGLPPGCGLLIERCRCIHMFFMRFAIDAVFLDAEMRVCKIVERLKPWRIAGCRNARSVVELPAGAAKSAGFALGQATCLVEGKS